MEGALQCRPYQSHIWIRPAPGFLLLVRGHRHPPWRASLTTSTPCRRCPHRGTAALMFAGHHSIPLLPSALLVSRISWPQPPSSASAVARLPASAARKDDD